MLYDPKWQKPETKADPLELSTLIAWLEKQPLSATYSWRFADTCLLGQYFKAMDCPDYEQKSAFLGHSYTEFGKVAGVSGSYPWMSTYGEALQRARALAAQQS